MKGDFNIEVDALIKAERARLQDISNNTYIMAYGYSRQELASAKPTGLGTEPVEPVQEDKPTKPTWLSTFIGNLVEVVKCAFVVLGILFVIIEVIL
jgi:hypothetical protein